MKRIGTSEAGNPIVEIEPADRAGVVALGAFLAGVPVMRLSELEQRRAVGQAPRVRTQRAKPKPQAGEATQARAGRKRAPAAAPSSTKPNRSKKCATCGKAFYDESRTNSRRFCGEGKCRMETLRERATGSAEDPAAKAGRGETITMG